MCGLTSCNILGQWQATCSLPLVESSCHIQPGNDWGAWEAQHAFCLQAAATG